MKTKIYVGRDLIGRFNCDGKNYTKFQLFKLKSISLIKRSVVLSGIFSVLSWSLFGMYQYGKLTVPVIVKAEEIVKEVQVGLKFDDIPMLVKICKAESGSRQFNKKGDVIRGKVNPSDIGFCQINEYINNDEARRLGFDIYTEQGNKDYAVWLYLHRGEGPWLSSKGVWGK